jgi:molybdate transport system substrate-binding protein
MSRISLATLICFLLGACSSGSSPDTGATDVGDAISLTVFAAASLTDPFEEIAQDFQDANPGVQVILNFAGSQQLALQLELGARADVLATADERNMDHVVAAGLVSPAGPRPFAHNRVVVILPEGNPGEIESLADLARPGVKLVLAGERVPVGAYARQVLAKLSNDPAYGANYADSVLGNVVSYEENVKQVVAKVVLGEADAGFVYSSDVTPAVMGDVRRLEIPEAFNVRTTYPISVLDEAAEPDLAIQFIDLILGPTGQTVLHKWGLLGVGG